MKSLRVLLAAVVLVVGGVAFTSQPAECVYCTGSVCYESSDCFSGCACVGDWPTGHCMAVTD